MSFYVFLRRGLLALPRLVSVSWVGAILLPQPPPQACATVPLTVLTEERVEGASHTSTTLCLNSENSCLPLLNFAPSLMSDI